MHCISSYVFPFPLFRSPLRTLMTCRGTKQLPPSLLTAGQIKPWKSSLSKQDNETELVGCLSRIQDVFYFFIWPGSPIQKPFLFYKRNLGKVAVLQAHNMIKYSIYNMIYKKNPQLHSYLKQPHASFTTFLMMLFNTQSTCMSSIENCIELECFLSHPVTSFGLFTIPTSVLWLTRRYC